GVHTVDDTYDRVVDRDEPRVEGERRFTGRDEVDQVVDTGLDGVRSNDHPTGDRQVVVERLEQEQLHSFETLIDAFGDDGADHSSELHGSPQNVPSNGHLNRPKLRLRPWSCQR